MIRRALLSIAAAVLPLLLGAQAPSRVVSATPYTQTISINPLGLPFGLFSAEYEVAPTGGVG